MLRLHCWMTCLFHWRCLVDGGFELKGSVTLGEVISCEVLDSWIAFGLAEFVISVSNGYEIRRE